MELSEDEVMARTEVGSAIRRLHHAVVGHHNDPGELTSIAWQIDDMVDALVKGERRSRPPDDRHYEDKEPVGIGELMTSHGDRPFSGPSSPYGLDFVVHRSGENEVATTITLGPAHEGAPGRSHGGIVAGFFDDLTGFVMQVAQASGFTGELTVRYVAPVPLGVPLQARAWLTGRSGRKVHIEAELCNGEQLLARCAAIYVVPAAPPAG